MCERLYMSHYDSPPLQKHFFLKTGVLKFIFDSSALEPPGLSILLPIFLELKVDAWTFPAGHVWT